MNAIDQSTTPPRAASAPPEPETAPADSSSAPPADLSADAVTHPSADLVTDDSADTVADAVTDPSAGALSAASSDAPAGAVAAPPSALRAIRREIDALDATLVDLVARRAALARTTAPVKAAGGLPLRDHRREADLVRRAAARAREQGLDPEPVRSVFWTLLEISRTAAATRPPEGAAQASREPGETREAPDHG